MADPAKEHTCTLARFDFGFLVGIFQMWKENNPDRLEEPLIKAFDKRITKHFEDAYRKDVL